jgi:branched-chain amino acid transport system permease protein
MALLAALAVMHLLDSRTGRAIRALKSGVTMAEAMGISTFSYKVTGVRAGGHPGLRLGLAVCALPAHRQPLALRIAKGIEYLFMAVLGGVGHVWGAFVGAGRGEDHRGPAAGAAAQTHRHQRQLRDHRLRHRAGGGAEVRARGPVDPFIVGSRFPAPRRVRDWADAAPLPERSKPHAGELLLDVQAVRKQFGGLVAVNDVSFTSTPARSSA